MEPIDEGHKPNHSSLSLYYHVVFVTLGRDPFITAGMARFLGAFFQSKCAELGVHLLAHAILCDHVHLLVSLRPSHYLPEVINFLKGTASHEANHHHTFSRSLYWMRGYHIDSVSSSSLDRARNYIHMQHKHHPARCPAMQRRLRSRGVPQYAAQHRLFQAGATTSAAAKTTALAEQAAELRPVRSGSSKLGPVAAGGWC